MGGIPNVFNILIAMVNSMVSGDEWGRGQVSVILMSDSTIHRINH